MLKNKFLLASLIPLVGLLCACSGGGGGNDELPFAAVVDEEEIKSNYVEMAHAAYADSLSTATALQDAVDTFLADPTDENLLAARAAYKATRSPYQQSEIMRFDTPITINADLAADGGPASVDDWEGQVNAWPLDEAHIDSLIEGSEEINTELLLAQNGANDNEANVTTGVHAVEYMLWGPDLNGTGPGAGERPASDYANSGSCADAFCERRAAYLRVAVDLLVSDLSEMVAEWTPSAAETQGTLAYNFMNSELALDYIVNSMRLMAADELAGARMGSGLELGDPEEEHDCFSDLSHVAIFANYRGVKNAYYGEYGSVSGTSLAELVQSVDDGTHNAIKSALDSIEEKMQAILDAGEREVDTVRYDQIIGQAESDTERQIAQAAVNELTALDDTLHDMKEALSLSEIDGGGGGDSD